MMRLKLIATTALAITILLDTTGAALAQALPKFEPDPYWPKHLPNNWILGQVSGVSVDSRDHIWVILPAAHHRRARQLSQGQDGWGLGHGRLA